MNVLRILIAEGIDPIWAVISAIITGAGAYMIKQSSNKSNIEIAKINSSSNQEKSDIEQLRRELGEMKESYREIKEKYIEEQGLNESNERIIADYSNLLRHYRFIFKLIYKQVLPKLEDADSKILLEEVKTMFEGDFKL